MFLLNLFLDYIRKDKIKPSDFPECQECGACCSYFKVNFKLSENPQVKKLGENIFLIRNKDNASMIGADTYSRGRCGQLRGVIGKNVSCGIYEDRPNVCRQYQRIMPSGYINPRCIRALNFLLKKERVSHEKSGK